MEPNVPTLLYYLRLYWDHSLLARAVLYAMVVYGLYTALIVIVEFLREALKKPIPRTVSHQLVGCWVACFSLVVTMLVAMRILQPVPR